jgi:tripartite ATP-independent transporter DctP family solute receptor
MQKTISDFMKYRNLVSLLFYIVIFNQCAIVSTSRELKLGHGMDTNHPVHHAMVYFSKQVDSLSGGKLKIQIYPASQLGSERELIELLQIGSVDITKSSAAVVESFAPSLRIFGVPYLFKDESHMRTVLEGELGENLLLSGTEFFLRGLCYYDAGSRNFYTLSKKVEHPDDLKGLKIRVQPSNTALLMVQSFDAAATPISFGELYTALQQGVVDGAENNLPSFYLTRHFEVCKYYIIDEHTTVPDMLLISEKTWQTLSDEQQIWVKKAAMRSYQKQIQLWKKAEQEALDAIVKAGVTIIRPDKKAFAEKTESVMHRILDSSELMELYKKILEE